MSNQNKFKVGDRVRVVYRDCSYFNEIGTVTGYGLIFDSIKINSRNHYMLEFFEMLVVLQLLSMEIAIRLGNDVDMPRNLAKSVTVE